MKKKYTWNKVSDRDIIITLLQCDSVILADSDTVLGLFAPITQRGRFLLNGIKQRRDKPYLIVLGDKDDWNQYAQEPLNPKVLQLIDTCWPGPLTLIMRANKNIPVHLQSKEGTVALRMPDHEGLQEVAKAVGGLFSTSANKAGQPVPEMLSHVDSTIQDAVACMVYNADKKSNQQRLPSTILDCTGKTIKVLRRGAYAESALAVFLK